MADTSTHMEPFVQYCFIYSYTGEQLYKYSHKRNGFNGVHSKSEMCVKCLQEMRTKLTKRFNCHPQQPHSAILFRTAHI